MKINWFLKYDLINTTERKQFIFIKNKQIERGKKKYLDDHFRYLLPNTLEGSNRHEER